MPLSKKKHLPRATTSAKSMCGQLCLAWARQIAHCMVHICCWHAPWDGQHGKCSKVHCDARAQRSGSSTSMKNAAKRILSACSPGKMCSQAHERRGPASRSASREAHDFRLVEVPRGRSNIPVPLYCSNGRNLKNFRGSLHRSCHSKNSQGDLCAVVSQILVIYINSYDAIQMQARL